MSNAVVACTWGPAVNGLAVDAEELLTVASKAATGLSAPLHWLALADPGANAGAVAARYGVASLDRIDDAKLTTFAADVYVEALAQYASAESPVAFLFAQGFDTRVVAPRLAGRLGGAVASNAVDAEVAGGKLAITASAYGGDTRVVYEFQGAGVKVVNVTANAVSATAPAAGGAAPATRSVAVSLAATDERVKVVERPTVQGQRLEEAQIIVSGGRGLGKKENYKLVEELAAALGGMAGASRPIVDDGWVDSSRQVGLTGRITRPVLYLAAGISGASQHMAGCSAAKTIAAINTDKDAAIFRYARYGVVGDCVAILAELTKAAKGG